MIKPSCACDLRKSGLGFALSTTHVSTGAILGAAIGRHPAAVRWGPVARMALAWLLTLPASAMLGALAAWTAARGTAGTGLVAAVLIAVAGIIYSLSRRTPVTAATVNDAAPPLPVPARVAA